MERICKNCEHFNTKTSVCDWKDIIKLENDWCYGFFAKEEKENKMTVSDFKKELSTFTSEELTDIIAVARHEIYQRDQQRREELKRNFFKAWKALVDDGAEIYLSGGEYAEPISLEDVEIE